MGKHVKKERWFFLSSFKSFRSFLVWAGFKPGKHLSKQKFIPQPKPWPALSLVGVERAGKNKASTTYVKELPRQELPKRQGKILKKWWFGRGKSKEKKSVEKARESGSIRRVKSEVKTPPVSGTTEVEPAEVKSTVGKLSKDRADITRSVMGEKVVINEKVSDEEFSKKIERIEPLGGEAMESQDYSEHSSQSVEAEQAKFFSESPQKVLSPEELLKKYQPRRRKGRGKVPSALAPTLLDRMNKLLFILLILVLTGFGIFYGYTRYEVSVESQRASRVAPQIEQAVIKNPRDLNARIALAEAYLNLARYKDAIKQYNQALKINKNAQAAIVGLGIAYMMLGKNDKALQYFEREIDNFAGKQWSELNPSLELAYYYAASLWFRKKNYDTAIAYLIKALELKPASADTYFLLGRVYFEKREYDEAIKRFEEALRYDPKFPDPYYGIGLAYEKKGNQEEAIKYYRRALRMKPDFEQAKAALQRLEE